MKLTKEYLASLDESARAKEIFKEFYKCKTDPQYCIETYFTVVAGKKRIPFKLFPHQIKTLESYENYQNVITMKTRQMGFTTFSGAWVAQKMMTNNNYQVLIISKTMLDTEKFIDEIKTIINEVIEEYPWLCKGYHVKHNNKRSFKLKETNSLLIGQSTTANAGRGFSAINCVIIDEVAFVDRNSPEKMKEIVASTGPALTSVQGKFIAISTPKGQSGWYYETYMNAHKKGFRIVDAHWMEHPTYKKGAYQWIKDDEHEEGGYLKFLTEDWPEEVFDKDLGMFVKVSKDKYQFTLDGKIRSPWYDFESRRLGPMLTRCELDCSFMGTGGEVFDADLLREIRLFAENSPYKNYTCPLNGAFKEYKEYIPYEQGHRYVLSADVATGDGDDFSAFAVIDIDTMDICATFKGQLIPDTFGKLIYLVGKRYGLPPVVIENAGGGGTTLQTLKQDGYPNIYYSTLKKNDPSTGLKKRKIGLWLSQEVRWQGGDRLEEVVRNKRLKNHCMDLIVEFDTWIWDKDNKRRHAPGKNDDLIMAVQHGVYYIYYFIKRADRNKRVTEKVMEVRRNGKSVKKVDSPNKYSNLGGMITNVERLNQIPEKYRKHSLNIEKESGMNLRKLGGGYGQGSF